jgi:hypothetical protein
MSRAHDARNSSIRRAKSRRIARDPPRRATTTRDARVTTHAIARG